jgi:hypothetical protein
MLSRAFLASLNVCGGSNLGAWAEGIDREFIAGVGEGEGVKDPGVSGCLSEREETGLRASFSDAEPLASSVFLGDAGAGVVTPFGWTIVIGTLRLFGPGGDGEKGCGLMNNMRSKTSDQGKANHKALLRQLVYHLC